jgi:hypothetical protein
VQARMFTHYGFGFWKEHNGWSALCSGSGN